MIAGLGNDQGLYDPIDGGIGSMEPRESENDVFLTTVHDIEEVFLGNPFNVHIEGASIMNCISFVHSLIYITNCDREGEFFGGELVFSDKLPVNAEDVCTRIY